MNCNPEKQSFKNMKALLLTALSGFFMFIALKYIFLPVVALFCAVLLAMLARLISDAIHIKNKKLRAVFSSVLLVLFYLGSVTGLVFAVKSVAVQLYSFCSGICGDGVLIKKYISYILGFPRLISGFIGEGEELLEGVSDALSQMISGAVSAIPSLIRKIALSVPEIIITVTAVITSSVILCSDKRILSISYEKKWLKTAGRIVYSYLSLSLFVFSILFLWLSLMNIKYSFILSLITTIVDVLPVFGVGTVLIPWAALEYLSGRPRTGTLLLLLFAVVTAVRKIIEPKIIGEGIGLSPLIALFSMFSGYTLLGVRGVIFAPLCAVALIKIYERIKNERA